MSNITINGISMDPAAAAPQLESFAFAGEDAEAGYALIQIEHPLQDGDRAELAAAGATLLEFVPDDTYVAAYPSSDYAALRQISCVRWAGPYFRGFKIGAELLRAPRGTSAFELLDRAETGAHDRQLVDIVLHQGVDADRVRTTVAAAAGLEEEGVHAGRGKVRASVSADRLSAIAAIGEVRHIEPVYEPALSNDVAVRIVRADQVHNGNLQLRGQGEIVAVCDTGFDEGSAANVHPAFTSRVVKLYPKGRATADDPHGHGTHVAGSVLGAGTTGGQPITGTAPDAKLVLQSVLDASGGLGGLPNDLYDLFLETYQENARIHTNSWGTTHSAGRYTAGSHSLDEFVWDHRDQVVCFAAGNPGSDANGNGVIDLGSVEAPGTAKNCITVGASESVRPNQSRVWGTGSWLASYPANPIRDDLWADNPDGMAAFSGRGPTRDGRIKPDLVAPGTSILSTHSRKANVGSFWGTSSDDLYCYMGGTSMATPLAAGAAAVVRQFLKGELDDRGPSAALVKAAMINGAVDLQGQYVPSESGATPNHAEGFGRLHLARTVGATPHELIAFHEEADKLGQGQEARFAVSVRPGSTLKATLAWTDPPGEALQNDLDLIVQSGSREMHGNVSNVFSAGQGHFDRVNNVEQVVWSSLPDDGATVVVRAHRIAIQPQPFALVIRVEEPGALDDRA